MVYTEADEDEVICKQTLSVIDNRNHFEKHQIKELFDMESTAHSAMFAALATEKPFSEHCPEVEEYVEKIEKDAQKECPFTGIFAVLRWESVDIHFMTQEWKRVGDRMFVYNSGALDPTFAPDGAKITDNSFFFESIGMPFKLLENGDFMAEYNWGAKRLPNIAPFRVFDKPEEILYEAKEALCIGKADR